MNFKSSTCFVDFAITLRWYDEALIGVQGSFGRTPEEYKTLWSPKVEINNEAGIESQWDPDTSWNLKDYDTGEIKFSQRYKGHVMFPSADLSNFPFDVHVLDIILGPRWLKSTTVMLVPEIPSKLFNRAAQHNCTSPDGFSLSGPPALTFNTNERSFSNFRVSLILKRSSFYFLAKVIFINMMISLLGFSAFLSPVHDAMLERVNTIIGVFWSSLTFIFFCDKRLPDLTYLTRMDGMLLRSFTTIVFIAGVESVVVSRLDPALATKIDSACFIIFPIALILMHVWLMHI